MFLMGFFAILVAMFAVLVTGIGVACFGEDEGYFFLLGIIAFLSAAALGSWSFMLFVNTVQLASAT